LQMCTIQYFCYMHMIMVETVVSTRNINQSSPLILLKQKKIVYLAYISYIIISN
jgi:hypothetical protein